MYKVVIIVPSAMRRAETWGMRSAGRKLVNVLQTKCLRSLARVKRMDRGNEEARSKAGVKLHKARSKAGVMLHKARSKDSLETKSHRVKL